jgi:hypothetical protein
MAGVGGVQSCGSVWACPVCSERIQAGRQAEVAAALAVARLRGWEVLFLTLTMRHNRDHRLKRLWHEYLSKAWRATTSGSQREWKADKAEYGIEGYLRLVEVTHGESGWHVHAHVLLFCSPTLEPLTDLRVDELGTRMFLRWRSALNVKGVRPSLRRGVDIRRVRSDEVIAEYFAKNIYSRKGEGSTAHDVTGSHAKDAKNGNRTPFGILRNLVDIGTGEVGPDFERDLELWHTYETVSKGRRQLLWSQGLRAELGITAEKTDQEIVDEDAGGEVLEWVTPSEWKYVTKRRMLARLLDAAEADDTGEALCAFLNLSVRPYKPDL